jgi:hypothetical protein
MNTIRDIGAEKKRTRSKVANSTAALWNQFADEIGSFADEHSTL